MVLRSAGAGLLWHFESGILRYSVSSAVPLDSFFTLPVAAAAALSLMPLPMLTTAPLSRWWTTTLLMTVVGAVAAVAAAAAVAVAALELLPCT